LLAENQAFTAVTGLLCRVIRYKFTDVSENQTSFISKTEEQVKYSSQQEAGCKQKTFNHDDSGSIFLRNISEIFPDYMVL
jgi:hypothetical protein